MNLMIEQAGDFEGVSHCWHAADEKRRAYGTLRFGQAPYGATIYFNGPADVDAVVTELLEMRDEMTGGGAAGTAPDEAAGCPA